MRAAARRLSWILAAGTVLCAALVAGATLLERHDTGTPAPTQGEKVALIKAERSRLQAQAGGEARIGLLAAFRIATLLTDALAVRADSDEARTIDQLPANRRQAFADIDSLNAALRDAVARPGEGARLAALAVAERARLSLERLAGIDDLPLVIQFTPRFVPPRRGTGDLALAPNPAATAPPEARLKLRPDGKAGREPAVPTVPRYVPAFAAARDDDPAVQVEIVGLHLSPQGAAPPVLAIGNWRGQPTIAPERLRFSVPRDIFVTDAQRATLATGLLSFRRGARTVVVELPFVVLPDRPGSFAFDQKQRDVVPEANTLVSPEVVVRAPAGETRTLRRCFDPPEGWRFDKRSRRVIVVERLGWLEDTGDPTLNAGSVEFAPDAKPDQVCVVVTAKPATQGARTATIGRFEATLVRDHAYYRVVRSGVRALDWREAVRIPIEPGMVEWKLYVRLFDEIDREFSGTFASDLPFLHIEAEPDGKAVVLRADSAAEP